ncbi:hypothetical protein AAFF_G00009610 [Aldrovandia affinis]|uniref:Uncharacterized protein n=1 Tax=Aldrovandia affinis TaxID=143900 RepID=A0AAD7WHG0_9TELE|nr:hypothetical protein AAFF_G00009610 [Aldrovandia affinis]
MFASSPEQSEPNLNPPKHDNWNILSIMATTVVVLLIGIMWISQHMVKSSLTFIEEESNRLNERLLLEEKWNYELAGQNKILEFELKVCESKRSYQESLIKDLLEQFQTINRKCQERVNALRGKPARAMWAKVDLKSCKEKHKTNQVCASEETLPIEIQDMEDICKLLGKVRTTLVEIFGARFESSPGSFEQDPSFKTDCVERLDQERDGGSQESPLDQERDGGSQESPLEQERDGESQESLLENMTIQQELHSMSELHQENHYPQQKLDHEEVEQQLNRSKCKAKKVKAPKSILIQDAERRERTTFPKKQVHWSAKVT